MFREDSSKNVSGRRTSPDKAISSDSASELLKAVSGGPSGLQFTLTVAGLPPTTFVVAGFTLVESFSSPWRLEADLASASPAVPFEEVLDNSATLCVWQDGELQRRVSGIVAAFEQGDTGRHQTRYSMTLLPAMWRASLRRNARIFQQQTPEEIIRTLLRESGVATVSFMLRHSHPAREFCVQYQEDDLSFINRLSAEEGMYYYFRTDEAGTLVFADDAGTLSAGPVLPWNPAKETQKTRCVSALSRSVRVRPARVELKDYTFKNPAWPASFNERVRELHNQRGSYEYYDFPGRFKDEQHGRDFTRYQLEGLRNDADTGRGQSNEVRLTPGTLFTLTAHPREELNTRWQPVSVTHTGRQPQALQQETGEQGTTLTGSFVFIPAHQTWRPRPLPKPRMDGAQTARVVGPPGEEIYCDGYGRVRVQFPWDRYAQGDDTSSCWIRVSQPWAGEGWGMIATPRVGQEVVVEFLHGDPDQPVIIGRTYHASNLPSTRLPAAKTQMAFRSKTHKGQGYNELLFEDANGQERLSLHAQKDMTTVVKDNQTTLIEKGNQTLTVQTGNRRVVLDTGDEITEIGQGSLTETVKQKRETLANSILSMAQAAENSPGVQKHEASDQIELRVGEAKITLTTGSVTINFGEGSRIILSKEGISLDGTRIDLNKDK